MNLSRFPGAGRDPRFHEALERKVIQPFLRAQYRLAVASKQRIPAIAIQHPSDTSVTFRRNTQEIEKTALAGSMSASLSLAKMYDNGIVVDKDKAKMLAWLRWGKAYGTEDDNVQDELDDMLDFYSLTISDSDKATAQALLERMENEHQGLPRTKRAPGVIDRAKDHLGSGFVLMGGAFIPKNKNST